MSYLDSKKRFGDDQIAAEAESESKLMCQAHNCPNKWSVNTGGRLCSAHAWADPMDWGAVTQRILSSQFTRVQPIPEPIEPMTTEEKRYVLRELANSLKAPKDYKAWAHNLKRREEAGEQLSPLKRKMWRDALRVRDEIGGN